MIELKLLTSEHASSINLVKYFIICKLPINKEFEEPVPQNEERKRNDSLKITKGTKKERFGNGNIRSFFVPFYGIYSHNLSM